MLDGGAGSLRRNIEVLGKYRAQSLTDELGGSTPPQATKIGLVVQMVRIPACHAGGREFESRPDR